MSDQYLGVGGRMVTVDGKAVRMPQGPGDMQSSVYDPNNKHQDIFAYVDNAIKDVKVTTDATPTQGSTNPVQSGGVYSALNNKLDKTGNGSNVTAAFTAASTRANIATGEKLSVLFGKIAKWLADLGSLAFKSTVAKSDLAAAVQTSLGKADTALQEHQSLAAYRTAAEQNIIDNGKQDKITSTNKLAYSLISGTPTIPTVPTNVSSFTNDAGYLTLATLPKYEGVVE